MNSLQGKMNTITQALGVIVVFMLIFPTALENAFIFLLLISYFASGNYLQKWLRIKAHPLTRPSLVLFGLLIIGLIYTTANMDDALSFLNKYRKILLIPIVISLFNEENWRLRAYYALLVAIGVGVTISLAMRLGWLPPGKLGEEWIPFKGRIAYGVFLAFATYLIAHRAILATTLAKRLLWAIFALLTSFDLLFLVSGRTGHIVFVALLVLLAIQYRIYLNRYGLLIVPVVMALAAVAILTSPAIKSRVADIDVAAADQENSSIGQRLIFWKTSLRIIADHPLIGAGTGSFGHEFSQHAYEYPNMKAVNPHSEYFLMTCQLGLIGLVALLWLFFAHFRWSRQLPPLYGVAAQGLVVAMAVGCLFNSFLLDHGEGHYYVVLAGMFFSSYVPGEPKS
jgi:O-antigen ligase